jgi:hypothetical protein
MTDINLACCFLEMSAKWPLPMAMGFVSSSEFIPVGSISRIVRSSWCRAAGCLRERRVRLSLRLNRAGLHGVPEALIYVAARLREGIEHLPLSQNHNVVGVEIRQREGDVFALLLNR